MTSGNPNPIPGVIISVRVTPRGGRDAVVGWRDEVLHVRVSAPPANAAANKACSALIARVLRLRRAAVRLVSGETARNKRFALEGIASPVLVIKLTEIGEGRSE